MSAVRRVLSVLGILGLLAPMPAFAQIRDLRPVAGTGVITGVVVSDDADAKPVRKARVTCGGADVAGQSTITDDAGRFVFEGLMAGRYTITASKATWITTSYGAKRPLRPGTPVPVTNGQTLALVIRLVRGAAITGVLLDYNNQPAAGAQVRALRPDMTSGQRRLTIASDATTDDRGRYRLYGLAPGDYFVSASVRRLDDLSTGELRLTSDADVRDATSGSGARDRRQTVPRTVAFAPVYFPSGTNVSQAAVVSLRPGDERDGIDFALQLVPTARIDGTVTLPEGGVPAGTEINLIAVGSTLTAGLPFAGRALQRPSPEGAFSFAGVPPGQYTLLARGSRPMTNPDGSAAPSIMVWASTQIAVDGEPISGLVLSLEPGLTIAGRLRFTDSSLKPPNPAAVMISAIPADTQSAVSFGPSGVRAGADGRFSISGVIPGRYRLSASFPGIGRAGDWQLESITANAQDALDAALVVQPGQHVLDAVVTFSDRLGQISGTVRAADASPAADSYVVLFPEDQRLWFVGSRRLQSTRAAADGTYTFRGVPAGTYFVALIDDLEPGEWFDPSALLPRLQPGATRVILQGTETLTRDLKSRD